MLAATTALALLAALAIYAFSSPTYFAAKLSTLAVLTDAPLDLVHRAIDNTRTRLGDNTYDISSLLTKTTRGEYVDVRHSVETTSGFKMELRYQALPKAKTLITWRYLAGDPPNVLAILMQELENAGVRLDQSTNIKNGG